MREPKAPMAQIKVAHLSPHRDPFEPRTFFEAMSGAGAGLDVAVIAPHDRDEIRENVRVLGIPRYRSRLERITVTCWRCVRRGLDIRSGSWFEGIAWRRARWA